MRVSTLTFLGLVLVAVGFTLVGQPSLPPVFLNHVTIFIPPATYSSLLESPFLRNEFSGFDEKPNTAQSDALGTWTYTGIFVRGQHAYIELFQGGKVQFPGESVPRPTGQLGFHMSIDNRNQLPLLRDRAAAEMGAAMQI